MPGRNWNSGNYRFGFNGKENDNDIKGSGNQQDYGMRIYDTRLGRFLSVDPLFKSYTWNGCYNFAENKPIIGIDLDGLELLATNSSMYQITHYYGLSTKMEKVDQYEVKEVCNKIPEAIRGTDCNFKYDRGCSGIAGDGEEKKGSTLGAKPYPEWDEIINPDDPNDCDMEPTPTNKGNDFTKLGVDPKPIERANNGATVLAGVKVAATIAKNYSNMKIWDAKADEKKHRAKIEMAIKLVNGSTKLPGSLKKGNNKSDLVNFILDGRVPKYNTTGDKKDIKASSERALKIMDAGIKLMQKNGIDVAPETLKARNDAEAVYKKANTPTTTQSNSSNQH